MSVIRTRVANTCRFDTRQEGAEILKRNTTHESLTIRASKPNDLCKGLTNITGHCDAEWAGPNFSWPASVRDRGLLPCPAESQNCVLWAHCQLMRFSHTLNEIGRSFPVHARGDSSTALAVETKQGASGRVKLTAMRFLLIQDLVFPKLPTMSAVKTDVNPSDIGTTGLGNDLADTCSPRSWGDVSLVAVDNTSGCKSTIC